MIYEEGLEMQLLILEDAIEASDIDDNLTACANCYQLEENCNCDKRELWPIEHVIAKLRYFKMSRAS